MKKAEQERKLKAA